MPGWLRVVHSQHMRVNGWKKWLIGTIGTIAIGAVGSGIWDLALKPIVQRTGQLILTVATLGSATVKDEIYREAAKGLHEAASQESLILITWLFMISAVILWVIFLLRLKEDPFDTEEPKTFRTAEEAEAETIRLKAEIASMRAASVGLRKRTRIVALCLLVELLLVGGGQSISALKITEANRAYTFFAQSMVICGPYIDDQKGRILKSRFALIQGRAGYIDVTNSLRKIAQLNHLQLPNFRPW